MARLTVDMGSVAADLEKLAGESDAKLRKAVKAGADLLKTYTANEGRSLLHGKYWTGQTVGGLVTKGPTKTADGYVGYVTYEGTNKKGNRNGQIAFYNEYGVRRIPARPFNRNAVEKGRAAILQRMADEMKD